MEDHEFHLSVLNQMAEMVKAQHNTTQAVATAMQEAVKPIVSLAVDIATLNERTKELHTPLNCPLRGDVNTLEKMVRGLQIKEAWRSGVWAVIGGLVALLGAEGISRLIGG